MNAFKPQLESLSDRLVPTTITLKPDVNGTIYITGTNSGETINVSSNASQIVCNGTAVSARGVTGIVIDAKGGNDYVDASRVNLPTVIHGGTGHDILFGGTRTDKMFGGDGHDRLIGLGGYDYLDGGAGSDFLDDGNRTAHEWYADETRDGSFDAVADTITPAGGAKPWHVEQEQSRTCVFLATLGSMAQSGINPNSYVAYRGVDSQGVGQYDVQLKFNGAWRTVRVQFATLTNEVDAKAPEDFSSWTIILNRAWMQTNGNQGAQAREAFAALGFNTSTSYLNGRNDFATLSNWMANNGMAVAVTKTAVDRSILQSSHAYQVVQAGYVNGVAMVQVRNPWAIDISHRYVNDGYFWMTWAQFKDNFGSVAYAGR